jgi:hypothetical protein
VLKLPLMNLKGIISKGIILDIAFPDNEYRLNPFIAILIYNDEENTDLYIIDMYSFICVGKKETDVGNESYITYFDTESICIKDTNRYENHALQSFYPPLLLFNTYPQVMGSREWKGPEDEDTYTEYITTLGECYNLYNISHYDESPLSSLNNLLSNTYNLSKFSKLIGKLDVEICNIISYLEENYPSIKLIDTINA